MQFTCDRQRLADMLALLNEIAPARSPKAALQNVLVEVADDTPNTLAFSATDLEIGLRHRIEVSDLADAESVLLPAARLFALVRDDRSKDVRFTIENHQARIRTEYGRFTLHGAPTEDFPALPDLTPENAFSLHGDDIADAIQKTLFSVAKGDMRYALNGVFLSLDGAACEFVSSDTHRLSRVTKRVDNPSAAKVDGIAVTKGMSTLAKLALGRETVTLCLTPKQLLARTRDAVLTVRLVEGQFPRYRDVIPEKLGKRVTVNREELAWRLRGVGGLTNEETHGITLATKDGRLEINATGNAAGEGAMDMEAEIEGGEVVVGFNYLYLNDLLKVLDDEKLTLQVQDADHPARVDSGDFTHVLMPIRTGSRT